MNDYFIAATTSVMVHGLVFFAQVGTMKAPVIDVNRAPSSIELSLVASRAAIPKVTKAREETIKMKKIDPVTSPAILKQSADEEKKTNEKNVSSRKNQSLNTRQGALGHAQALSSENSAPVYPRLARERGYEGEVVLKVEVMQNGDCGSVSLKKSSGYRILDDAAVRAVRGWKFKPAMRGLRAFTSAIELPIVFRLKE
jgi:protein TonB